MKRVLLGWLLLIAASDVARAQNPAVVVDVDNAAQRHAIDPRVYGVNFGDAAQLADLNCPLSRLGGSHASRYNWNVNAYNRADDWYFESIVENGDMTPGAAADAFIDASKAAGAEPMMTIPMVGWVAKVGAGGETTWSFSVNTYGAQTASDGDAGNGISAATGDPVLGNDPNDASLPADQVFQQAWVQHIIGRSGLAADGGLKYYLYDNEPGIWHVSHRDVHPDGASMEEVRDKSLAYGAMIKALDPNAVLVGPEEWNWDGYFSSGMDVKHYQDFCATGLEDPCVFPDRTAHGGMDYVPWLLDQMYQSEVATGQRLLDVFAVHFYPQGDQAGHQEFSDDVTTATQLLRNRSTRSLWDPTYVDQSYMGSEGIDGGVLKLIPRLKDWAATYYPSPSRIEVGLTEYNWGAENHMNGATTQADILGILGREGLDLAARWEMPATDTPVYNAFKIYRNYDGAKSTFGDASVSASAPNPDHVAAFAAQRTSDDALTVMLISKYPSGTTSTTVNLANFAAGAPAQVWRLASNTISRLADVTVNAGSLTLTLPAQSVTLLVLPEGPALSVADTRAPEPATGTTTAVFTVTLSSASGQAVTVDYATADGTATAGVNYLAAAATLTFDVGVTTQTVGVTILANGIQDPNLTFTFTLSGALGATLDRAQATGTIIDNALVPKLQFSQPAYVVSEAGVRAVISVRRVGSLAGTVGVSYAAYDGTATNPADYAPTAGPLSFPSGVALRSFSVPIVNDTLTEGDETILLRLSDPTGGALLGTQPTAVLTIRDNDLGGKFAFGVPSATLVEGKTLTITVRRTGGFASAVTVRTFIAGGTAVNGVDYTFSPGTLTFAAGQVSQTLVLQAVALAGAQGNRTILLGLDTPTGGSSIGTPATELITLQDADPSVQFSAATYTVSEAAAQATITVKRTGPLTLPLTVDYAVADGTTGTPATDGLDYTATTGTLGFAAGVAARTFAVKILPDTLVEGNETVDLQITNASVGAIGTAPGASGPGLATLTITDNDPQQRFQFSVATYTATEPAGTLPVNAVITVKRTGSVVGAVTVDYTVADGTTGTPATDGSDYTATTGTLSFANGVAARTFLVQLLPDTSDEGTETVSLALSNPIGAAVPLLGTPSTAVLNIVDNEPTVQFSAANYSVSELATKVTIAAVRKGSLLAPASVDYTVTSGTATDGLDFAPIAGTLDFAVGIASRTFAVTLLPDLLDEPNETVNLTLSNPIGTALGTPVASTITILDNDTAGKVQFAAAVLSVGETAGTAAVTVTRTGGTAGPATVDYATGDGTALDGTDYTAAAGPLTFAPSQMSQSFTVAIADQPGAGPNRFLNLTLSNPGGGLTLGAQAAEVLWIVDEH